MAPPKHLRLCRYHIMFGIVSLIIFPVIVIGLLYPSLLNNVKQEGFHQSISWNSQLILSDEKSKTPRLSFTPQDDSRLIHDIRKHYLNHPSRLPYNLTSGDDDPSYWQAQAVQELLKNKTHGFFIECGALDGEYLSNTLMFEKVYGWEGLLIESNPDNYKTLLTKHRKAWTIPACLSINVYPSEAMMKKVWHLVGSIARYSYWKITNDPIQENVGDVTFKVQCFPLYTILLALNRTNVDYLSLDVEGNELNILKTIPWDKVNITIVTAEFNHVDQGKHALREYMESQGYKVYLDGAVLAAQQNIDFVFYHPKLLQKT